MWAKSPSNKLYFFSYLKQKIFADMRPSTVQMGVDILAAMT
jgi:hypothetical protein